MVAGNENIMTLFRDIGKKETTKGLFVNDYKASMTFWKICELYRKIFPDPSSVISEIKSKTRELFKILGVYKFIRGVYIRLRHKEEILE